MAKIRYGLSNCYYALLTVNTSGVETYATPVKLPGSVALTLESSGETVEEFADNITWYKQDMNNGYSGTFECEVLGDDFRKTILGETEDTNGVLWEASNVEAKEFALLGQFEIGGDATDTGKRFALLRCTVGRPALSGNTKEASITPQHDTLNISAIPRISDHLVKATCYSSNTTGYNAWFNAVPTKSN